MGNKTKQKSVSYDVSLCLPFAANREEEQDWIENVKATFLIMNSNTFIEPIPVFVHVIPFFWNILIASSLQLISMNIL